MNSTVGDINQINQHPFQLIKAEAVELAPHPQLISTLLIDNKTFLFSIENYSLRIFKSADMNNMNFLFRHKKNQLISKSFRAISASEQF